MQHRRFLVAATLGLALPLWVAGPAAARHRHRPPARPAPVEAPTPFSFYPETIEGGSPGNLPFNNQIRKLKDPLNANGAGG